MNVEPAHVDQVRQAADGRWVVIDADVCGVVADLQEIDPGFGVRFAEGANPPFFAVFHQSEDRRTTQLVLTQTAKPTESGTWSGLDQRIVDRVREIDSQGRSGYDFAAELERQNKRAREQKRNQFRERMGEIGEQAYHAVRKDLGHKSRAYVSADKFKDAFGNLPQDGEG